MGADAGCDDESMSTLDRWKASWHALGVAWVPSLQDCFDDLVARYSERHRKYHTLQHLDECFSNFDLLRPLANHAAEVEIALWFHDAIYDPRSKRNEANSSALATKTVLDAGGSTESAGRIEALVMATRHAAVPRENDARVLVDVDLSILGAPAARFDEYEAQVREEYAWVPGFIYRRERRKILQGFLARPAIFSTAPFLERYEQQARVNIGRSLGALGR